MAIGNKANLTALGLIQASASTSPGLVTMRLQAKLVCYDYRRHKDLLPLLRLRKSDQCSSPASNNVSKKKGADIITSGCGEAAEA